MIIVKIVGGLGNQMFQYALGRSLSLTTGENVYFDISWFEGLEAEKEKRKYELNNFNASTRFANNIQIKKFIRHKKIYGKLSFLNFFLNKNDSIYIKEKAYHFDPNILNIEAPAYLDGFWQSEKYFIKNEKTIRQDLVLKNEPTQKLITYKNEIINNNAISLHIRRTDYLNIKNNFYYICPLEYYYDALKIIEEKYDNPVIFIFSDDITWVKNNLKIKHQTQYVEGLQSYEDMTLMSLCRHNIMANSTFSWWGAWLNNNPQKTVIAPKHWFTDKKINTDDLYPKNWIRI